MLAGYRHSQSEPTHTPEPDSVPCFSSYPPYFRSVAGPIFSLFNGLPDRSYPACRIHRPHYHKLFRATGLFSLSALSHDAAESLLPARLVHGSSDRHNKPPDPTLESPPYPVAQLSGCGRCIKSFALPFLLPLPEYSFDFFPIPAPPSARFRNAGIPPATGNKLVLLHRIFLSASATYPAPFPCRHRKFPSETAFSY